MLDALISSRTRINLLLKFFINPDHTAYLRGLAEEFNESTNAIRVELNRFQQAGMLETQTSGNRKIYKANNRHPLFTDIRNIILKHTGINDVVEYVVKKLGKPEKVYLTGDFAKGRDSDIIDIIIVGNQIDKTFLVGLVEKAEKTIKKRIRYITYSAKEFENQTKGSSPLVLIWGK
ncbi:MAG: ArsR family transcriptional regulator [Bacteroidales bacterium]|nr:ArsR family transcriptional regulator [Bacteroidales bacterium]